MKSRARYLALFRLFPVINSFEWFWFWTPSKGYPVYAGVPQGSIIGPKFFLPYINDLSDDVICNIAKCDQASDPWQQLGLVAELESELQDIVDCGRKWLVDFNTENIQLVSFDQSYNTDAIEVKMDGSFLEEKIMRI